MDETRILAGLREVLALAATEAGRRGVARFGPEYWLEALLRHHPGRPVRILREQGIALDDLQFELLRTLKRPPCPPVTATPDDAARQSLEQAETFANTMGCRGIGQTHLLLALLSDPATLAGRLLRDYGVEAEAVLAELAAQPESDPVEPGDAPPAPPSAVLSPLMRELIGETPELMRLWRLAEYQPEHLLATLLYRGKGRAIQILRDCGIDLVELSIALEGRFDVGQEGSACRAAPSRQADAVIEQSRRMAGDLRQTEADTEHLLLALLQIDSAARSLLADFHLNEEIVLRQLGQEIPIVAAPVPSPQESPMSDPSPPVLVSPIPEAADLPLPAYETAHAAGMDLRAAVPEDRPLVLESGRWALVPTGLKVAIPPGVEGQVRPRSGLALRHGIGVLNGPGTIDADYRGEIGVILFNFSEEPFTIRRGDRIAQLIFSRVLRLDWEPVAQLPDTDRGEGGFGHTGR